MWSKCQDFVLRYLHSNTNHLVMFSSFLDPLRFCRPPASPQLNAHVLDNLKGFIINKIQPVDFLYICKWDTAVPVYVLKKATMSNCPPECILAALPSSSSPVDPDAEDCDCHCHGLKGYSNFSNFHPNKIVTVMCSCYKLYYFEPRNIS